MSQKTFFMEIGSKRGRDEDTEIFIKNIDNLTALSYFYNYVLFKYQ